MSPVVTRTRTTCRRDTDALLSALGTVDPENADTDDILAALLLAVTALVSSTMALDTERPK